MNEIPAAIGLAPDQVEGLLTAAGRAPSLHNSQPWRFRVTPHMIELFADRNRALPVIDPRGRELRLACGAALFNVRLALHGYGVRPTVTILPDPNRPDLIAEIRNGGSKAPTPEQQGLLRAVPLRRTNRHPFSDAEVSPSELNALHRAALEENAWLHFVQEHDERTSLQDMASRAHRTQMGDPAFRTELAQWTAVAPDRVDGVPASAGGPLPAPQHRWVHRDFTGAADARTPAPPFEEEPVIAVLTAHLSGERAEIQAGQALQRVLLTATVEGLAVSFLSQIVEVQQTREELRRLVRGTHAPQAVLRIGHGWPVTATRRRQATDLLGPVPVSLS
jgi:nitroreductase